MKYAKIQKLYYETLKNEKLKEVIWHGTTNKNGVMTYHYFNNYGPGKRDCSRRANGFCIDIESGTILYLKNGIPNREDGPARIGSLGLEWYVNGIEIEELANKETCKPEKLSLLLLKYSKI